MIDYQRKIEDGRFDGGTALPSSRDLAESLKIARDTVVKAYRELLRLGYLISDTTSGTYANMERVKTQPSERQINVAATRLQPTIHLCSLRSAEN
ncbi:MAG: winged helix-turn-helix transcriptional regulator [Candidatus Obscuribacter sp.]|nr:winged helix-turn-helix transcriptional regulator [Candidatus Obscuribacter sp.]